MFLFVSINLMARLALGQTSVIIEREIFISDPVILKATQIDFESTMRKLNQTSLPILSFVDTWLSEWRYTIAPNGLPLASRRYLDLRRALGPTSGNGKLGRSMNLIAIAFRLDRRTVGTPAGEGRLIFSLRHPLKNDPLDFTLILEFRLPVESGWNIKRWASEIHHLGAIQDSREYVLALKKLVSRFSNSGRELLALRTNDFFLDSPWELRDFHVSNTGFLEARLITDTPDLNWFEKNKLVFESWLNSDPIAILKGEYSVPFGSQALASRVPDEKFIWPIGTQVDPQVRHQFAVNTCNGCHSGETNTRFVHVWDNGLNQRPLLSEFLQRSLRFRAQDLSDILESKSNESRLPVSRLGH